MLVLFKMQLSNLVLQHISININIDINFFFYQINIESALQNTDLGYKHLFSISVSRLLTNCL